MTSTNSHVGFTCCLCVLLHCVWKCHINVSDYWAKLEITGVDVHPQKQDFVTRIPVGELNIHI